mmetsp:Transcript_25087/g.69200  ORF Transcript_25087/g.69200 Transcript_25087/m.69200 type:complete len:107 (-) Transcript_25087:507-827(-)
MAQRLLWCDVAITVSETRSFILGAFIALSKANVATAKEAFLGLVGWIRFSIHPKCKARHNTTHQRFEQWLLWALVAVDAAADDRGISSTDVTVAARHPRRDDASKQ